MPSVCNTFRTIVCIYVNAIIHRQTLAKATKKNRSTAYFRSFGKSGIWWENLAVLIYND